MLVLTRKPGDAIQIARDVRVHVLEVRGQMVRIGVEAPKDVAVWRTEVWERMTDAERDAPGGRR